MRSPSRRRRTLTTRGHLVALFVGFVIALVVVTEFQGARQLDQARDEGRASAQFVANLGAEMTAEGVATAREQVDALAANPGIPGVLEDAEGCTLTTNAVPPFSGGHLDIVATDGTVVCSPRELPPPGWYSPDRRSASPSRSSPRCAPADVRLCGVSVPGDATAIPPT